MMAESLDSRKFERKTHFDVPLPIRKVQRMAAAEPLDDDIDSGNETPPPINTMAFSLMTKKGNRPQVTCLLYSSIVFPLVVHQQLSNVYEQTRTIDLPSDSTFAVSMKSQQEAEREEQRRIKNLVLNYDLRDDNDGHDGTFTLTPIYQRPLDKSAYAKKFGSRTRSFQPKSKSVREDRTSHTSSPQAEPECC